jgi:uncharacterized protein
MSFLETHPEAVRSWEGEMPVTNRYTYGLAGEKFFRAIKDEGRILGTRCSRCERTYVPAVTFCERCFNETTEWVDVGLTGEVHTFTLVYEDADGKTLEKPELVAFVHFADGGLVHRLGEIDPQMVKIGMKVEAVFKPAEEREGSILDILHFKPADHG